MNAASTTHLVLIPSYNPGDKVYETVRAARAQWQPVWVVVDRSTAGTAPVSTPRRCASSHCPAARPHSMTPSQGSTGT